MLNTGYAPPPGDKSSRPSLLLQLDHQRFRLEDEIGLLIHPTPILRIDHLEVKVPDHP